MEKVHNVAEAIITKIGMVNLKSVILTQVTKFSI